MNVIDFQSKKDKKEKISMVTCYDYTAAKILAHTPIDALLVGDSLAMTMHGQEHTVTASMDLMVAHTRAVAASQCPQFIISDMPFLSYRLSRSKTMQAVGKLMQAGAEAIKLEGADGNLETIAYIVESGIPVMGHIGLTPQFVHSFGGYRVQGRDKKLAAKLLAQAKQLEQAGCFAIVLECMPASLAKKITQALSIPTIGIGAGPETSGQILVWQDLLGMENDRPIHFVKSYLNGFTQLRDALNTYHQEVCSATYPGPEHCYAETK